MTKKRANYDETETKPAEKKARRRPVRAILPQTARRVLEGMATGRKLYAYRVWPNTNGWKFRLENLAADTPDEINEGTVSTLAKLGLIDSVTHDIDADDFEYFATTRSKLALAGELLVMPESTQAELFA